jgi:hypothetical protein
LTLWPSSLTSGITDVVLALTVWDWFGRFAAPPCVGGCVQDRPGGLGAPCVIGRLLLFGGVVPVGMALVH